MRYFNNYSQMYYQPSFWPSGLISLLVNLLVWGVIIYLAIHLIRKMSAGRHHHGGCCGMHNDTGYTEVKSDAKYLDIVKERYAKGEIDKKQFEELKKAFSEDKTEEIVEEKGKE